MYDNAQPYRTHRLAVDDIHALHIEECGTPTGIPAVLLHGGPGSGFSAFHRGLFDPTKYRLILFDQRGAGRSSPTGKLLHNTTQDLLGDIELIREHLGIDRWLVVGGSWGSTLALAYAQLHPHRVSKLILRGIFLGRGEEIEWFNERTGGARWVFPERWARYEQHIAEDERDNLIDAYWRRLRDSDPAVRLAAARAWNDWDAGCTSIAHDPYESVDSAPEAMLNCARIQLHYFRNGLFLEPNQILRNIHRLQDTPATILQGRYDIVCPPLSAFELARGWQLAKVKYLMAGHSVKEPAILEALVAETDSFAASAYV